MKSAPAGALAALALSLLSFPTGCAREEAAKAPPSLDVLVSSAPEAMDPYSDTRILPRIVFSNVYEPLISHTVQQGEHRHANLVERWSTPSPTVWELRLRPGPRFHDGSPLAALDVVRSLERARAPGSAVAGLLADVESVTSPEPGLVVVKTHRPADLLKVLGGVLIVRPGPGGTWVGTGPFRPTRFDRGRSVVLSRFDGCWTGKAPFEEIRFQRFSTADEALQLLARMPQAVVLDPPAPLVERARLSEQLTVASEEKAALAYLAMSAASELPGQPGTRNPFADIRVRRALQLALDGSTLLKSTPAGGILTSQIAPPGVLGFDPARPPVARDLPGARRLLEEAGYGSGLDVTLDVTDSSSNADLARAIASELAEASVRVRLNLMPSETFRRHIDGGSSFFLYSWITDDDPAEELRDFFHTRDPQNGLGLMNRTRFSNPAFDVMIQKAIAADAGERRVASLHDALYVLDEDLPWIPLFSPRTARVYPRWLRVRPHADGLLYFAESEIVPQPR